MIMCPSVGVLLGFWTAIPLSNSFLPGSGILLSQDKCSASSRSVPALRIAHSADLASHVMACASINARLRQAGHAIVVRIHGRAAGV